MKDGKLGASGLAATITGLIMLVSCQVFAAHMKPEMAAKKENHRKQEEQRITPEKRKVAIDALKAERLKVYKAKKAAKQTNPVVTEIK
jgi:hypothetical protein